MTTQTAAGTDANVPRAAFWVFGAILAFSLMAIAGKELSDSLNTFEIMFWRSLVGLGIVAAAIGVGLAGAGAPGLSQLRTRRPGLHLFRNVSHFFGQNCWFYAVGVIPLAQVFALEFTSPIWLALIAPFVLGEQLTRARAAAAFLGFLGVLAVVRPFGADAGELGVGQAVALAASLGFAGNLIATKKLSATETTLCILFWMTLSQALMAALCDVAWRGAAAMPAPEAGDWGWLVAVGCCGLTAHFCLTNAFRHAPATVVAPIDFFRLPLIAVAGYAFYAQPIEALTVFGGAVIFLGNYLNLRAERTAPRA